MICSQNHSENTKKKKKNTEFTMLYHNLLLRNAKLLITDRVFDVAVFLLFALNSGQIVTLFRMGLFGTAHGWGKDQKALSLNPVTYLLQ